MPRPSPVLAHALPLPIMQALQHRRVVLASASPRRKDLLRTSGLAPEVVPSTFEEDLDKADFKGRAGEYPVLTAQEKVRVRVRGRVVLGRWGCGDVGLMRRCRASGSDLE